ncbi:MAG: ABC transporter permease [Angustibacter sp.]
MTAAPASLRRRVLAQAGFEAGVLLRNGEQLLVAIVLPALALVVLTRTEVPDLGPGSRVDLATPGILALAVMSTAFTGQAIQTGFDRRYGVLRQLATSPLGRSGLIAGKTVAVLLVQVVQLGVLSTLGLILGWRPNLAGVWPALLVLACGTAAFVALALLLAGTLRAEAVLAVANVVWILLIGGVVVPTDRLPGSVGGVAAWLPSGALGDGVREALVAGVLSLPAVAVLLGWTIAASAIAARTFRWQ